MPDFSSEISRWNLGNHHVIGIDEAGRGPLAGPVVAAATSFQKTIDPAFLEGLDDSKKLSEKQREEWFVKLNKTKELTWAVSIIDSKLIDKINILQATYLAMRQAVDNLALDVDWCLIDGKAIPHFSYLGEGIIKGDSKSYTIAAASIFAKVTRDRLMKEYALEFPEYGFEKHKGYGTKAHLSALQTHGACRIHRQSFKPVFESTLPVK